MSIYYVYIYYTIYYIVYFELYFIVKYTYKCIYTQIDLLHILTVGYVNNYERSKILYFLSTNILTCHSLLILEDTESEMRDNLLFITFQQSECQNFFEFLISTFKSKDTRTIYKHYGQYYKREIQSLEKPNILQ